MPEVAWGRRTKVPLVIAHRGASAERRENTLSAFARAAELGADGIELDVMRCGSGEVVVFHDDDLQRLAKRSGKIRTMALDELRTVDLGGGERIPTLDEVLRSLAPGQLVNIELKAPERARLGAWRDEGLAPAVAGLIARHGVESRTMVSSFDPLLLGRFRRVAPKIPIALLFELEAKHPLRTAWLTHWLKPAALHPDARLVDPRSVGRWHRTGYAINVWTVDDPREIAFLVAVGVDGVITNRPAEARRAILQANGG